MGLRKKYESRDVVMTTKLAAILVEQKQWMRARTVLHRLTHENYFYALKIKVIYTLHFITLADFQKKERKKRKKSLTLLPPCKRN